MTLRSSSLSDLWQSEDLRLGDLAVAQGKVSRERLEDALDRQRMEGRGGTARRPLGQILIQQGALTTAECAGLILEQERLTGKASSRRIGGFLILYELGRGGLGVVWSAWDTRLNRGVAVKTLKTDDEMERRLLEREARMAGQLTHPNIVPVHEVVEHEGQPCIVMGLVEGKTLEEEQGRSAREWVRWVAEAARGVHFAHTKGVIHRDLKPANIMVDRQGKAMVLDFGLAKELKPGASLSRSGAVIGTPAYMAPEQALGQRKKVGPKTDVYGLGATLYSVLAGRPPFWGDSAAKVMMKVLNEEPASLRKRRPDVAKDLETVVGKAMAKEPQRRYGSAEELAEDLERWLKGEAILAKPSGIVTQAARRIRRHWGWAVAGAVTITLVAAGGMWWKKEGEKKRARWHLEEARVALQEADRVLYREESSLAPYWDRLTRARASIERALRDAPGLPESYYLRAQIHQMQGEFPEAESDYSRALDLDPDFSACRMRRALMRLERQMLRFEVYLVELDEEPPRFDATGISEELNRCLSAGGNLSEAELGYARVAALVGGGKFEEADAFCDEALTKGETENLLRIHAFVLLRKGSGKKARERLWRAIRLKHYDAIARLALAAAMQEEGGPQEALRHLEIAYAVMPSLPEIHLRRSVIQEALGDREGQLRSLTRYLELVPNDSMAHYNRASVLVGMGRLSEAEADYGRAIELARAAGVPRDEARARNNRGNLFSRSGRLEAARADFEEIHRIAPAYRRAYANWAMCHWSPGNRGRGEAILNLAVEIGVADARVWNLLAQVYRDRKEWDRAYAALDKALQQNPTYPEAFATRATCHYQQRRWEEAMRDLDRAVELAPQDVEVRTLRSRLRREQGQVDAARADADEALRLAPDSGDVLFEHAHVDRLRKDWNHLESCADQAAQRYRREGDKAKYARSVAFRGLALGFRGQRERAFQDLEEAAREWPEDAVPHYYRGILLESHDRGAAIEAYRRALRLDPELGDAWSRLGKLYHGLQDYAAAAEALAKAVAVNPLNRDAWSYLGISRHFVGDYRGAVEAFTRVLEFPSCAQDWANRAAASWMLGAIPEAERDARKAIDLDSKCVGALEVLGRIAFRRGDHQEALAELTRVLELDPKRSPARALRGEVLAAEGRVVEALEDLEQAIRDDPGLRDEIQPLIDRLRKR